ncbi:hypothetical protein DITRI_Ditri06bG0107200 [Diplodiscus trichospermus]
MRNEIIFKGKSLDIDRVIDLFKLRSATWMKAKWPSMNIGSQEAMNSPNNLFIPMKITPKRKPTCWTAPLEGYLKFNVDGSSRGKPGPVGIGCILGDHLGRERIRLSKSIGVEDSNVSELLAIREAFIVFATSKWTQSNPLIIKSDSKNAVNWILKPNDAPWRMADELAKEGVDRSSDLLVVKED